MIELEEKENILTEVKQNVISIKKFQKILLYLLLKL